MRLKAFQNLCNHIASVVKFAMSQTAAMSVDQDAAAGVCGWWLQQEVAVWMVQEDEQGRYRKFPQHLNDAVEQKYVEWKLGGDNVVQYDWQNAAKTSSVKYEIMFDDMRQKNMTTMKVRAVERYLRSEG